MPRPGRLSASPVGRFGGRLRDAAGGVVLLYRTTGNARIETLLAYLSLSAALAEGGGWRVVSVVLAAGGVLAAEAVNTAVERAVDRIGPERHVLSAAAKDAAAGAVLIAALGSLAVAVVALVPHVAACWMAWQRAAALAKVAWVVAGLVLTAGVVRPETAAQGGR